MQRLILNWRLAAQAAALVLVVPVAGAALRATAAEAKSQFKHSSEAQTLVQAALDAELAGDAAQREALLAEAREADPAFAPAHWQSGQVMFYGKWRTPDDVQEFVANHPRWTEYRNLRESLGESPDAHLTLAEFCREHGLANEARFHWANVLLAWPQNREAREALGLEEFKGGLFTHEQVAAWEQQVKDAKATWAELQPRFTALCRDATGSNPDKRDAALAELRTIDDVTALDALDAAINRFGAKSPRHALDLHRVLVAALANMPQPQATMRLLNYAVFCPTEELRQAAAEALALRPQTDYVPILMVALTAPIDYNVDVIASPDGTVRMTQTTFQQGFESAARHVSSVNFETDGVLRYDPSKGNPGAVLSNNLSNAAAIAEQTQARVEDANARADEINQRIADVLKITSKYDAGTKVEKWWATWQAHNELQYTSAQPVFETSDSSTFVYRYEQLPIPTLVSVGEPRPAHGGCFKPGTLVWTQGGPIPIEKVGVGDLVLAQSPQTGELAYRAVLKTTLGRPTRVMRMQFPHESIVATYGHRFWVDGHGWAMTKSLSAGAQLHALEGPVQVESLTDEEQVACHNLVVDEFHTYFVGETKLLVHDIGCPLPALAGVPGSEKLRTLPPLDPPLQVSASGW